MNPFDYIRVYPQDRNKTLVDWELSSNFTDVGPYAFTLQLSRSANPDVPSEWVDIVTMIDGSSLVVDLVDQVQRYFSTFENWFYRIKLVTGGGIYYSNIETTWGTLPRSDRLIIREMYRQECLRLTKKVGTQGLLLKRKYWGPKETNPNIVDPDTGDIINPLSATDLSTSFVEGYWKPIDYTLEFKPNKQKKADITDEGNTDPTIEMVHGLAWPIPRTRDVWVNCYNNKRYYINGVVIRSQVKHIPVTIDFEMREAPPDDVIYKLAL